MKITERAMEEVTGRDGWVAVVYAKNGKVSELGDVRRTSSEALRDLRTFNIDSRLFRKEVRSSEFAVEKKAWTTWKERGRSERSRLSRIKRRASQIVLK